jgi:hypothetical protein
LRQVENLPHLAAANEGHDFQPVAVGEQMLGVACARNDLKIDLDSHSAGGQLKLLEQFRQRDGPVELARLTVDNDSHLLL